ncbi:MAG: VOC family protein [Alphaproteobacteria bacterium]|nr:VOC family protein [Alphaproteobacteria bacterium]
MTIQHLEHVNMRTGNLEAMTAFYDQVLGLKLGDRPAFQFNGTWLYCGDMAVVHLVEDTAPLNGDNPQLEHFAFRAEGLADFLARLRSHKVAYECRIVPGREIRQVHTADPDGNHIEIAFGPEEQADLTNYDGA